MSNAMTIAALRRAFDLELERVLVDMEGSSPAEGFFISAVGGGRNEIRWSIQRVDLSAMNSIFYRSAEVVVQPKKGG